MPAETYSVDETPAHHVAGQPLIYYHEVECEDLVDRAYAKSLYEEAAAEGVDLELSAKSNKLIDMISDHHTVVRHRIESLRRLLIEAEDELDVLTSVPMPVWTFTVTTLGARPWNPSSKVWCQRDRWKIQGQLEQIERTTQCNWGAVTGFKASRI